MRIIAAIDILGGKCVRLTRGDYSTKKIYNEDPLEAAKQLEDNGILYVHIVDLDGAREKRVVNHRTLERIAAHTGLKIDFGGGIRSDEDLSIAFASGAGQVTAGSIAATDQDKVLGWLARYNDQKIILGADSKNRRIAVDGWQDETGVDVVSFISGYCSRGMKFVISTDIEKDGMLQGPATGLYKEILKSAEVSLIASGGISSLTDIAELKELGCEGAIIGKAIYEGLIKLKELRDIC